jgi:hypothetical protein
MSLFGDLFGSGYQDAAQAQIQGLNNAQAAEKPLYNQAQTNTQNYGTASIQPFSSAFNSNTAGANQYAAALGIGGDPASVMNLWQNTPGYQFTLNQGLQAIDRGAASRGMLTSGNTLAAEQAYGSGLANQYYQNYVNSLQPYLGAQNTSATGLAQANQWTGGNLASENLNQGNYLSNIQTGIGNAQAAADTATQNAENSFINGAMTLGGQILGYGAKKA